MEPEMNGDGQRSVKQTAQMSKVDMAPWIWASQAFSGIALIGLVGAHLVAQHYLAAGGLRTYAEVVDYLRQPVALGLELAFLVVVTAHALLGVRAIVVDLGPSRGFQRSADIALWVAGFAMVVYGMQLTWQIVGR